MRLVRALCDSFGRKPVRTPCVCVAAVVAMYLLPFSIPAFVFACSLTLTCLRLVRACFTLLQLFGGMMLDAVRDTLSWLVKKDDGVPCHIRHVQIEMAPTKISTARVALGLPAEWIAAVEVRLLPRPLRLQRFCVHSV